VTQGQCRRKPLFADRAP